VLAAINLANANTWTGIQTFPAASIPNATLGGPLVTGLTSENGLLAGGSGVGAYNYALVLNGTTLSLGALGLSLNLGNPNAWTGLQTFGTNLSFLGAAVAGSAPTLNQILQYNGTNWVAATSGGGAVSSVSNADGTLTISPTTGAVVASLALGHANTWTGLQTFGNAISIGGATLAVASLATGNVLQYNGTNWVNAAVSGAWVATNPANTYFKVYFDGTTNRAIDQNTGAARTNATASALLNTLIGLQSGTTDITIEIDPTFVVDAGWVIVNRPSVNIVCFGAGTAGGATAPLIPNLLITDATTQIYGLYLCGLTLQNVVRNSGSNGQTYNQFSNCVFLHLNGATTSAITDMYEQTAGTLGWVSTQLYQVGDKVLVSAVVYTCILQNTGNTPPNATYWSTTTANTNSGIQYSWFVNCWFNEQNNAGATSPPAFWTMNGGTAATASNGHNQLIGCAYVSASHTGTGTEVFADLIGALQSGPPVIHATNFDFVSQWNGTTRFTRVCNGPAAAGTSFEGSVYIDGSYWEASGSHAITLFTCASATPPPWEGHFSLKNAEFVGAVTAMNIATPNFKVIRDNGISIDGHFAVANPFTSPMVISASLAQGTGATNPVLTGTGIGTASWWVEFSVGSVFGWKVTTPTAPNAGVNLVNMYTYPVDVEVITPGTAGACTITDQSGASQALGVPLAGRAYRLYPLEQITFATAWPTTMVWRGVK